MKCRNAQPIGKLQRGATSLLIVAILLIVSTLAAFYAASAGIFDMRVAANEVKARQAHEAAQAGIDYAVAYIKKGMDQNNNGTADPLTPISAYNTAGNSQYRVTYCAVDADLPTCPDTPATLTCDAPTGSDLANGIGITVSCGWSDDNAAKKRIVVDTGRGPALSTGPGNPLITKGAINVSGSATVTNYYNNLTIWSGSSLSNIGASGKTFVREPTLAVPPEATPPPAPPTSCTSGATYICSTDKSVVGADVIINDNSLSSYPKNDFFENFAGQTPSDWRSTTANLEVAGGSVSSLDGVTAKSIWVEGDASFTGSMTIGTRDKPVVLVVNGDWDGGGNVTVYGIVIVMDDFDVAGNTTIYGAAIVLGSVSGTGSLDVIFDPKAVKGAQTEGAFATVAGSWRDWE